MYTREELERLARTLPYQEIKDSPIHPYYTDWRVLSRAEHAPTARETRAPPYPLPEPHVLLEPQRTLVMASPGAYKVETLDQGVTREWRLPVEGRLDALHALRWMRGITIEASRAPPAQAEPLRVSLLGGPGYAGYHLHLRAPPGAEARLALALHTPPQGVLTVTLLVEADRGARVEVASFNMGGGAVYLRRLAILGEGAVYTSRAVVLGGEMVHDREDIILEGAGSRASLLVGAVSSQGEKVDSIGNIIARGPASAGSVSARGIVNGSGYLALRGLGRAEASARDSAVSYESYVLVMDEGGKGYSVPVLEVDTGLVAEARHSTAVAAPPEDEVFYLRQRGLSPREIRYLLTYSALDHSGALGLAGLDPALVAESLVSRA